MKSKGGLAADGFSLVELLVAMVILGIGLIVAVPGFNNMNTANKLTSQANELQVALNFARSEAIRLNQHVVFCHSANSSTCSAAGSGNWTGWLVRAAGANVGAETGPVLRAGLFESSVVVVKAGSILASNQSAIRYTPQGLARVFGNNTPLSDVLRVCIASSAVNPNIREVQFASGGRNRIVSVDGGGSCP